MLHTLLGVPMMLPAPPPPPNNFERPRTEAATKANLATIKAFVTKRAKPPPKIATMAKTLIPTPRRMGPKSFLILPRAATKKSD